MNSLNQTHNFFEIQKREHQELVGMLGEIHRALRNRQSGGEPVEKLIADFCSHVEQHIAEEEEDGYLAEAILADPQFAEQANALRLEHNLIREEIAKLRDLDGEPGAGESWWRQVEAIFDPFSNLLMRHEAQEDDLVRRALSQPGEHTPGGESTPPADQTSFQAGPPPEEWR